MLSDRLAIESNGSVDVVLSAQDPISCYSPPNNACYGGWADEVLIYLELYGAASDSCFPFASTEGQTTACPTIAEYPYICRDHTDLKKYKCVNGKIY
jgi:cathepsin B